MRREELAILRFDPSSRVLASEPALSLRSPLRRLDPTAGSPYVLTAYVLLLTYDHIRRTQSRPNRLDVAILVARRIHSCVPTRRQPRIRSTRTFAGRQSPTCVEEIGFFI